MEKIYTIYCHRNKINNKTYIGQTKHQPYWKRWTGTGSPYKGCPRFQLAIKKYGWDNFQHFKIIDGLTIKEANYYEELLISLFDTSNPENGYNVSLGGNNRTMSEETRQKIKDHHADFSGANHPMYGKHHTEETKQKIREKAIGRILSEETKKKISDKTKGGNNPRAKKVQCIETGEIFSCAKEAAEKYNVDNSCLSKCAKGKTKTCAGLHWKYI